MWTINPNGSYRRIRLPRGHEGTVNHVAFCPSGAHIVPVGLIRVADGSEGNKDIRVWSVGGHQIFRLQSGYDLSSVHISLDGFHRYQKDEVGLG
jgi:WD40 repeat protein